MNKDTFRNILLTITILVLISPFIVTLIGDNIYYNIRNINVPVIPDKIMQDMRAEIYSGVLKTYDYNWYRFYDETYGKVKTKLTGLSTKHYDTLENISYRIKFDDKEYRLKSLASEVALSNYYGNASLFSEVVAYKVSAKHYKYVPKADLVTINNQKDNLMILWDDSFDNTVREQSFVGWKNMIRNHFFATDNQVRGFETAWKTRDEKINNLDEEFVKLMDPILDASVKPINEFATSNLDLNSYLTYYSLANIFGSAHMDSHNLLFIADKNKQSDKVTWYMAPYDMEGIKPSLGPKTNYEISFNPVSSFILRNPYYSYLYYKRLNELNNDTLKSGEVEKAYKNYDCSKVSKIGGFNQILQHSIFQGAMPMDLNTYCMLAEERKGYDEAQGNRISRILNDSSVHWYWEQNEDKEYLVFEVPSPVGAEITNIKCGGLFSCKDKFQLQNKPWWNQNDDFLLLPDLIRTGNIEKGSLVPGHYKYKFLWTGDSDFSPDNLSISATNAATGKTVYPVSGTYPALDIKENKTESDKFNVQIIPINPIGQEFNLGVDDIDVVDKVESSRRDWKLVVTSNCEVTNNKHLGFDFKCKINPATWPELYNYKLELYYLRTKVSEYNGEFFPEYNAKISGEILNDTINTYKVSLDKLNNPVNTTLINHFQERANTDNLSRLLEKASEIYVIPGNKLYEITSDMQLPKDSVLWFDPGANIRIWPLINLEVGTIVTNGSSSPVNINRRADMGTWYQLKVNSGAYLADTILLNMGAMQGGLYGENIEVIINGSSINANNDIVCSNCNINIADTKLDGYTATGLYAKDSVVHAENIQASNVMKGFVIEDSVATFNNVSATAINKRSGTMDRVFELIGPYNKVDVHNALVNTSNFFLSSQYYPDFKYDVDVVKVNMKYLNLDDESIYNDLRTRSPENFVQRYPFLTQSKDDPKLFYLEAGTYDINTTIFIPEDITLNLHPGVKLRLATHASILAYGQMVAEGTDANPVIIDAAKKKFGAVVLRGEKSTGNFKYCEIRNGSKEYIAGTEYTGELSAQRGANLVVDNCTIEKSNGDDGINCRWATCTITNSKISNNFADGIDLDFTTGSISNNHFKDNGNDGIDISSDNSKIYSNLIEDSGDKGISVGEGSNSLIYNNHIRNNNIGIEVKDNSHEYVINNTITGNNIGINAYRKKRAYVEGGHAVIIRTILNDNKEHNTDKDEWSSIYITNTLDDVGASMIQGLPVPEYGIVHQIN